MDANLPARIEIHGRLLSCWVSLLVYGLACDGSISQGNILLGNRAGRVEMKYLVGAFIGLSVGMLIYAFSQPYSNFAFAAFMFSFLSLAAWGIVGTELESGK